MKTVPSAVNQSQLDVPHTETAWLSCLIKRKLSAIFMVTHKYRRVVIRRGFLMRCDGNTNLDQ